MASQWEKLADVHAMKNTVITDSIHKQHGCSDSDLKTENVIDHIHITNFGGFEDHCAMFLLLGMQKLPVTITWW